jgi:predicted DNA-binding protein
MTVKTRKTKQLNIKIPDRELSILENFTEKNERTKTDVIREFIRALQANN